MAISRLALRSLRARRPALLVSATARPRRGSLRWSSTATQPQMAGPEAEVVDRNARPISEVLGDHPQPQFVGAENETETESLRQSLVDSELDSADEAPTQDSASSLNDQDSTANKESSTGNSSKWHRTVKGGICYPFSSIKLEARSTSTRSSTLVLSWKKANETLVPFRFDPLYLRDQCKCKFCRDVHSRQKTFGTVDLPTDVQITGFNITRPIDSLARLNMLFKTNQTRGAINDHHVVSILLSDLAQQCMVGTKTSEPSDAVSTNTTCWTARYYEKHAQSLRNKVSFNHVVQDRSAYRQMLHELESYGLVFITDMPDNERAIEQLAETIGPLRNTFYGRTWDVKDKPNAENVAYTAGFLGLHMDLLYMKQPPGLQLLHCLRSSEEGGASIFSDSFRAANVLWNSHRDFFNILCDFPVTYKYDHADKGNYYVDSKPVIELDTTLLRAHQSHPHNPYAAFHAMPPIANINWSPPFQSPQAFTVDAPWKDDAARFRLWLAAARAFADTIASRGLLVRYKLAPGECVIFNNRRVLHGREAFTSAPGAGERWLKGAYLDADDFWSKVRSARVQAASDAPAATIRRVDGKDRSLGKDARTKGGRSTGHDEGEREHGPESGESKARSSGEAGAVAMEN